MCLFKKKPKLTVLEQITKDLAEVDNEITMLESELAIQQVLRLDLLKRFDIETYVKNGVSWRNMAYDLKTQGCSYTEIVDRVNNAWDPEILYTYDQIYSTVYKMLKKAEKPIDTASENVVAD